MVKIDIFSGFLGAGKTTLITRMLKAYEGQKVVLIENEFGEIGVDGGFLKETGFEIKEINSGCICCSLTGDFSKALQDVVKEYNPDRIIIEPSGVGKLSDIKKVVKDANLPINMLVTVVDAGKGKLYMRNFGEFFNNQVKEATTVLISKVDRNPQSKVLELADLIREKNPNANIITTPIGELPISKIISIFENDKTMLSEFIEKTEEEHHECHCHEEHECHCHEDHDEDCHEEHECHCHEDHDEECHCHDHHADEIFDTWGMETPIAFCEDDINNFLKKISTDDNFGVIIRAKGILKASDNPEWYYFDLVDDEYEIRTGKADYTGRVCVIGSDLDKTKIKNCFLKRA